MHIHTQRKRYSMMKRKINRKIKRKGTTNINMNMKRTRMRKRKRCTYD